MIIRRETIIALRARHTAFRIAVDILYPPQPAPEPAQPAIPVPQEEVDRTWEEWLARLRWEREWAEREARRGRRWIAIVLGAVIALLVFAVYDATRPPARPPSSPLPVQEAW